MKFRNEEAFTNAVIDLARMSGWLVHHDRGAMLKHIQGDVGFPDLVLLHEKRSRLLFAELKAPKGELSEAQVEWINGLHLAAFDSYPRIWRPANWDEIVETLTGRRPGGVL